MLHRDRKKKKVKKRFRPSEAVGSNSRQNNEKNSLARYRSLLEKEKKQEAVGLRDR
jgi:hypothetical protein